MPTIPMVPIDILSNEHNNEMVTTDRPYDFKGSVQEPVFDEEAAVSESCQPASDAQIQSRRVLGATVDLDEFSQTAGNRRSTRIDIDTTMGNTTVINRN